MTPEAAIAAHKAARERIEAEWNEEAQACAARHGYDTAALSYHLSRYQYGSLSLNYEAADARRLYRRAWSIALEHHRKIEEAA